MLDSELVPRICSRALETASCQAWLQAMLLPGREVAVSLTKTVGYRELEKIERKDVQLGWCWCLATCARGMYKADIGREYTDQCGANMLEDSRLSHMAPGPCGSFSTSRKQTRTSQTEAYCS